MLRFPRAVTHFSPGSAKYRPTQVRAHSHQYWLRHAAWDAAAKCSALAGCGQCSVDLGLSFTAATAACRPPALTISSWQATGSRAWTTAPTGCRRQGLPPAAAPQLGCSSALVRCHCCTLADGCSPGSEEEAGWASHHTPRRALAAACLQERAWVSGLAAANLVVQRLGQGQPADILPGGFVTPCVWADMQPASSS